jgi:hypothetical protein
MTQPKALRLADELSKPWYRWQAQEDAAAELRRLHEVNQELLAALNEILDGENKSFRELCQQARAAIAKGEQK